jgi:hypothetical protein
MRKDFAPWGKVSAFLMVCVSKDKSVMLIVSAVI